MTTSRTLSNQNKRFTNWKRFYYLTGIVGLSSIVFEILIYRHTIIRTFIPILIILSVGLGAFVLNRQHYNKTFDLTGFFFALMQNIISWGFAASFLFMATNYYFADKELTDFEFKIESKSSMPGSKKRRDERKPLVTIDYFGFKKELVFSYEDTKKVEVADRVKLSIRKGLLGFDIVDHYETVDDIHW